MVAIQTTERSPAPGERLYRLRHSAAHIMAQAVTELFPDAHLGIGPPIDDGFYYDFGLPRALTPEDLTAIEERMRRIVTEDLPIERRVVSGDEARALLCRQPLKLELLEDLLAHADGEAPVITIYRQGDFEDLCRGPHLVSTGNVPVDGLKLLSVSGAYWRGDESRPMLQRIYGTAWESKEDLDAYLQRREEARRRDHRVLGRELDLFSTSEIVGPGLILWHPRGAMVRVIAEEFSRAAHLQAGYEWVFTPHIGRSALWQTSGHLEYYRENMFAPLDVDGVEYYLKPVNCPFHIQIFKSAMRSHRDLPKRYAEFGAVYRYERSGELHGLTRVRGFVQDDAHIFCRPDQVDDEILRALRFSLYVLRTFGLVDFRAYLSTRPETHAGDVADWDRATEALRAAVVAEGLQYEVEEGGGAFYGPKIDIKVTDSLGREWQLSTIQFDFNLPAQFGLEYVGDDNRPHPPYMVHRALFGAIERFLGVLIEHYGGALPLWLSPVQVVVVPISNEHQHDYAVAVAERLRAAGIRVEHDSRNARMQAKLRDAQRLKVPYVVVVGRREQEAETVSVRSRAGEEQNAVPLDAFVTRIVAEGATRS
jgi:threonyl-tRNA synthetase